MRIIAICLSIIFSGLIYAENQAQVEEEGVHQHRRVQAREIRYGIHSKHLHEQMLQLNALVSYSQQPTIPLDHDSVAYLKKLIDTVGEVVKSAQTLKQMDPDGDLGTEQVSTFNALAEQLYIEAVNIEINARDMKLEEMDKAFRNLNETCIACHSMFRGL